MQTDTVKNKNISYQNSIPDSAATKKYTFVALWNENLSHDIDS